MKNRKLNILKAIRKKKKDQSKDEIQQIDFTGIQMNTPAPETVENVEVVVEERNDEPEQESGTAKNLTEDPEERRRKRKNLAIQEMFAMNKDFEQIAFAPENTQSNDPKPENNPEEGSFFCMCGNFDNTCGAREEKEVVQEEEPQHEDTIRTYKIQKDSPREKVGLSFVAFKQRGGIFVCKIKQGSKFNATGLKVGMRVLSINGTPCPERVGALMKMLKEVEKELVLEVERMEPLKNQNKTMMTTTTTTTKEEPKTKITEVSAAVTKNTDVPKKEAKTAASEKKAKSSQEGAYNSEKSCNSSQRDWKAYKRKLDMAKKRAEKQQNRRNVNPALKPRRGPNRVVTKDVEGDDTDDTESMSSGPNEPLNQNNLYDSDSSRSSTSFWTEESQTSGRMAEMTAMMDNILGASESRLERKHGKRVAPTTNAWSFF